MVVFLNVEEENTPHGATGPRSLRFGRVQVWFRLAQMMEDLNCISSTYVAPREDTLANQVNEFSSRGQSLSTLGSL